VNNAAKPVRTSFRGPYTVTNVLSFYGEKSIVDLYRENLLTNPLRKQACF